jgi:uridylate kinase
MAHHGTTFPKKGQLPTVRKDKAIKYKRVLLKLSGEVLGNPGKGESIDLAIVAGIAARVKAVAELGVQIAIVLGGGNIFRGIQGESRGIARTSGDYMGMLATIINGLALQNALEQIGVQTRVQTAIEMPKVAEGFVQRRALRHLEKGRIVIFAGGTGNPYFSTDTAAALRASEIGAEVLIKATKVDGIYSDNPDTNPQARRYTVLGYQEALERRLRVMDSAAFALCMDNGVPIVVCDFFDKNALARVVRGERVGTLVTAISRSQSRQE